MVAGARQPAAAVDGGYRQMQSLQIFRLNTRCYPAGAGSISQRNDPDSRSVVEIVISRWAGF
jgi:hypothetical protein